MSDVAHKPGAKEIFLRASELLNEPERHAYLAGACGGDSVLRQNIEAMVQANLETGTNPLDRMGAIFGATGVIREAPEREPLLASDADRMIGPYKLLEPIGEGGFGTVYMAEQTAPVRRKVALKVLKPGMDSRDVIARFEAERQALALMDHPNIAKVLDAGTIGSRAEGQGPRGESSGSLDPQPLTLGPAAQRPFFVMELVRGAPITDYCDEARLNTEERLRLFIDVCRAVQHAHQKGIIHRDLKPSNVLVTMHDDKAVPKVIDFGIAKALSQQLTDRTLFTGYHQMLGTPMYMSPEQAQMNGIDIDTRSDVYSLGVLLYELLTGTTPFTKESLSSANFDELRRIIREQEPPRPSARLTTLDAQARSTVADRRRIDQRRISDLLRGELDWIVMKSLEKDRNRRYESVSALAADVQRYLEGEPVQACPPTVGYRLRKYARRHKGMLTTTVLVALAVIAGTAVSVWQVVDATSARKLADDRLVLANQSAADATFQAEQAKRFETQAIRERDDTATALYYSDIRLAQSDVANNNSARAEDKLLRHFPYPGDSDRRGWEWFYLLGRAHQAAQTIAAHQNHIWRVAWSPDGSLVASTSQDGAACIWDATNWRLRFKHAEGGTLKLGLGWSPDSQRLAWGSAGDEGALRVWDRRTGEVELHPGQGRGESIWSVAWSHDGRRLATAGTLTETVRVWDVESGYSNQVMPGETWNVEALSWSPDDQLLASTGLNRALYVWTVSTASVLYAAKLEPIHGSAWHPSRPAIAVGTTGGECLVWDHESRSITRRWTAHTGEVSAVAWSPDGERIATGGTDGIVRVWDDNGEELYAFTGHRGNVKSVAWAPGGKQVVSAGNDGVLRVWELRPQSASIEIQTGATTTYELSWVDNSTLRVMQDYSHRATDWSTDDGTIVAGHELPENNRYRLLSDRFAMHVETGAETDPQLIVTDLIGQTEPRRVSVPDLTSSPFGTELLPALNPTSDQLFFVATGIRESLVVGLGDGTAHRSRPVLSYQRATAWSPDGSFAASVGVGLMSDEGTLEYCGFVHIIDGKTGAYVKRFRIGEERVWACAIAWSPDSSRIAAANDDGRCEVFDVASGTRLVSRRVHMGSVNSMAWSPDGKRLASGGSGRDVRIWDAASGEELLVLGPHNAQIHRVCWSPDGRKLASADTDGVIKVWDATAGLELTNGETWDAVLQPFELETLNALIGHASWSAAVDQCERMMTGGSIADGYWHYLAALMSAGAGDHLRYRTHCAAIVKATEAAGSEEAVRTAWTCAMAPDGVDDYAPVLDLARRAATQSPRSQHFLTVLGGVLLRAGRLTEAREQLLAAVHADRDESTSAAYASYLLAVTYQRLGESGPARQWLDQGNAQAQSELGSVESAPAWNRKLTLELLRREAETLIGPLDVEAAPNELPPAGAVNEPR